MYRLCCLWACPKIRPVFRDSCLWDTLKCNSNSVKITFLHVTAVSKTMNSSNFILTKSRAKRGKFAILIPSVALC